MSAEERLHKVLARAGVASRRGAEALIGAGRVTVNGAQVTRPGTTVDPSRDAIKVDGRRIDLAPPRAVWIALNKPRGCVTTLSDPEGRPTVADLLPKRRERLFPVGRLDFHSEGLLLFTNDGELARDLLHPGSHVAKTYLAKVRGTPNREALERISVGLEIDRRRTLPARAAIVKAGANAWIEVTVVEGRKHQVRRMLEAVGHPVQRLRRVGIGPLRLGRLPVGAWRELRPEEVSALRSASRRGRGPGRP